MIRLRLSDCKLVLNISVAFVADLSRAVSIYDVISEKGLYWGTNSVFLDQLFLRFCDCIFIKTVQGARKLFPLDTHKRQISKALLRRRASASDQGI